MTEPADWNVAELVAATTSGRVRVADVVASCLARIEALEPEVQAWAHLDAPRAMEQARALDAAKDRGLPLGPLHGVPVGIKDIIDVRGMPTTNGTVLDAGRMPKGDSTVATRLKAAGAVILGKTVSTELAFYGSGKTRNPHNSEHTPGGSSSGSAAAVGAGMIPLAIGTQTNGSVVRPASFCGVVGMKTSFGAVPRTGITPASPSMDIVGTFTRNVADAALALDVIVGSDGIDPDCDAGQSGHWHAVAGSEPPMAPNFAFVRQPVWSKAEPETEEAFGELVEALGDRVDEVPLPSAFDNAIEIQRTIMASEMAKGVGGYADRAPDKLSRVFVDFMAEGRSILAHDYLAAKDWPVVLNAGLDELFERYDAILTPATPGPAPKGLDGTGDPAFCTLWSLCGTPAISLPLMQAANGLPFGVQLVGPVGDDARLMRTARWLVSHLATLSDGD